jgi:hypothetical protein
MVRNPSPSPSRSPDLLGIYLNDHLAGATGGAELARRVASSQRSTPARTALGQLARDIAQDRATGSDSGKGTCAGRGHSPSCSAAWRATLSLYPGLR